MSFRGKRQRAFGLRLCSRIRVRAPCFHSLGIPWCPLFFRRFVDVFWGPKKANADKVGDRGGSQLFVFKNKDLVYSYLECLLPLRYGAFYWQPGGSSLDPRPDLSRLRRAPGRGRLGFEVCWVSCVCFVCCVCVCCVCLCVVVCVSLFYWVCYWLFVSRCACCWHLWVSLWHFAGPCGVSLALWVTRDV